jgi:hypothetical protein
MGFIQACIEGQELYQVTLGNEGPILFKLLPYNSFLKIQRLVLGHPRTTAFVEDEVWTQCVLDHPYQDDLDDLLAGTVSTVANLILFLSGLPDFEDKIALLNHSRYTVSTNLLIQIETLLCRTFPAYTPEMLEELDISKLFLRIAQAEMATGQEFNLVNPDEDKKELPKPGVIDFDAENMALQEIDPGSFDPHDSYGLRR